MYTKNLFINLTDPLIFQTFGGEEYWNVMKIDAGNTIFNEGEASTDFYYVFSGKLFVSKSEKSNPLSKKALAELESGDFFGEGALLSDKLCGATVEVTEDCKLLKLSQVEFERMVQEDSQAAIALLLGIGKVLNARLQDTNERLVSGE